MLNSEDQRFSSVLGNFKYLDLTINAHQFLQRKTSLNSNDALARAPHDVMNASHHASCRCIDHYSDPFLSFCTPTKKRAQSHTPLPKDLVTRSRRGKPYDGSRQEYGKCKQQKPNAVQVRQFDLRQPQEPDWPYQQQSSQEQNHGIGDMFDGLLRDVVDFLILERSVAALCR
jgi:hypothetical protein